jgi:hypothetical protein
LGLIKIGSSLLSPVIFFIFFFLGGALGGSASPVYPFTLLTIASPFYKV